MDAPYYTGGATFGFGLPGVSNTNTQPFVSTTYTQTIPAAQPVQTFQADVIQQQQPMMFMPVPSAGTMPTIVSADVSSVPSSVVQQPVIMGMMPVAVPMQDMSAQNLNEKQADAGRQLFTEAMHPDSFDPDAAPPPGGILDVAGGMPLPSPGSALHGTGRCQPCAWFWKPKGCQNAIKCSYCHLCPEGELKSRKKAKVTAMRMGALEPSAQGGAPPQIKLTQLLDA